MTGLTQAGAEPPDPTDANAAEPDEVLDCRGERCPLPVIALARRIVEIPVGAVIRVLADDPAAPGDIAAWCRMRDQQFLGPAARDAIDVRRTR